jgi:hypothetical protein
MGKDLLWCKWYAEFQSSAGLLKSWSEREGLGCLTNSSRIPLRRLFMVKLILSPSRGLNGVSLGVVGVLGGVRSVELCMLLLALREERRAIMATERYQVRTAELWLSSKDNFALKVKMAVVLRRYK